MSSSLKATKSEYDNESRRSATASLPSNEELIAKCLSLGLVMRRPPHYTVSHPTITLQPTSIPAVTYHRLLETQELWNEAVDNIARNYQFLKDSLAETATSDSEFTGNLLTILEEVYLPDPASSNSDAYAYQNAMLGIFRTDYMKHAPAQPETNDAQGESGEPAEVTPAAAPSTSAAKKKPAVVKKKTTTTTTTTAKPAGAGPATRLFDKVVKKLASPKATASAVTLPTVTNAEEDAATWKNVEINTISVSFAGLSPMVGRFLNYLTHRNDCLLASQKTAVSGTPHGQVVISDSDIKVPAALYAATKYWTSDVPLAAFTEEYAKTHNGVRLQPVVVVVIQENERNTGDQYRLLFNLLDNSNVVAIRRTYSDLSENGNHSFQLIDFPGTSSTSSGLKPPPFAVIEEAYIASVFFFRSSYVPEDFPAPSAWKLRTEMERSNAIKCPSIPHHLMTFKKMQQLMCDIDNVLAPIAFKGDRAKAETLAKHFMAQYSLNPHEKDNAENSERVIAEALEHPERFVLKPQLEGGGNLIAGEEMQKALSVTLGDDPDQAKMYWKVRKEYILMRRIAFPRRTGAILRDGVRHTLESNLCSELGIFGVVLSTGETVVANTSQEAAASSPPPAVKSRPASAPSPKTPVKKLDKSTSGLKPKKSDSQAGATTTATDVIPDSRTNQETSRFLLNEAAGYIVRSKPADVDDGGVMAGVAALDSLQFLP